MNLSDHKENTTVNTITIGKDMIVGDKLQIHIARSKKGEVIMEDIIIDNGPVKKGVRYMIDIETMTQLCAGEINLQAPPQSGPPLTSSEVAYGSPEVEPKPESEEIPS